MQMLTKQVKSLDINQMLLFCLLIRKLLPFCAITMVMGHFGALILKS